MSHLAVFALLTCALVASGQLRLDPGHYCRLSGDHQLCNRKPPSPEVCGRVLVQGAGAELRQIILDAHNVVRSSTAIGNVRGYDGFLPRAADMLELKWDHELAEIAQAHAEKCHFNHDCGHCKTTQRFHYVGQNLAAAYTGDVAELGEKVMFLIGEWYKEVRVYTRREVNAFRSTPSGHFTQMIWAKTETIGCGVLAREIIMNGGPTIRMDLFCNYGAGGNIEGEPVYSRGAPCSRCPRGTRCSTVFPGLCRA